MRACVALLSAIAAAAVFTPAASAVPLVLTDGSNLVNTNSNSLGTLVVTPVTGMQPAETLVGIDQRPATGQLYGIGSSSRLYVIDPATGAATQVGNAGAFALSGADFGTDFNPVPDRIRLVSNDEQNLRLNPNDGTAVVDALLNPAGNVVAAAYTNNVAGVPSTTLFEIDSASGKLVRQGGVNGAPPSPNGGNLSDVGLLGLGPGLNPNIGFDIGADGVAFATITDGGVSKLFGINTSTGAATNLGTIGAGATPYRGLAIMPARVRLTSDTLSTSEGGTATFQVTRNAPAAGPVTVDYSTTAGTATSGDDFTPASGTLTWAAGQSDTKTISVPVAVDAAAEGDETFSVALTNVTGADAVAGAPATAVATIAANDAGPALQFEAPAFAAAEGSSAALTVARVGSTTQPVSVEYAIAPGSADASDYAPAGGTVSWAAGDGAPKTISIPIVDDPAEEGAETFPVTLFNPTGGATLGNPGTANVTIAASDPAPTTKAKLKFGGATKQKLSTVKRKGVAIESTVDKACDLDASVLKGKKRISQRLKRSLATGKKRLRIKITRKNVKRLRARQKLTVSATCSNSAGKSTTAKRTVKLTR